MHDLSGRTILITGASSGLGWHFALIAARAGAKVAVAARRTDRLKTLVGEIGTGALAIEMDVETKPR
jgi:NADP-dependent 3-hydroxy acid dehydrogenase YdfG